MLKYILIGLLWVVGTAYSQFLTQEEDFLGIPGLESLTTKWFIEHSDSTYGGLAYPVDINVLKLSSSAYCLDSRIW
jgi:hypothetical protein